MVANKGRLNSKLGKKLGDGRLPFAMGKEGFDEAVSAVKNTLSNPSKISGQFTGQRGVVLEIYIVRKLDLL